jgi:hypothetical protein
LRSRKTTATSLGKSSGSLETDCATYWTSIQRASLQKFLRGCARPCVDRAGNSNSCANSPTAKVMLGGHDAWTIMDARHPGPAPFAAYTCLIYCAQHGFDVFAVGRTRLAD